MTEEIQLKTYQEVMDELEKDPGNSHLLLANGFNLSLGIKTDYKSIFERMLADYPWYEDVRDEMKDSKYDIEGLIGLMRPRIQKDQPKLQKDQLVGIDKFLPEFIENKIRLDFMKAAYSIVKDGINNVYNKNNEELYLLLEKFNNYFTLNYDPCLYLLLLKFKNEDHIQFTADEIQPDLFHTESDHDGEEHSLADEAYQKFFPAESKSEDDGEEDEESLFAFQAKAQFLIENLSEQERAILQKIVGVHDGGELGCLLRTTWDSDKVSELIKIPTSELTENQVSNLEKIQLNKCPKSQFSYIVKQMLKGTIEREGWIDSQVNKVIDLLWKLKQRDIRADLAMNDGFQKLCGVPTYTGSEKQNVFSLHGALYVVEKQKGLIKKITKITKKQENAFYEELEKVVSTEGTRIVCVLTDKSEDKERKIEGNDYLEAGFEKLAKLSGRLMIIGCALKDNDSHIFKKIQDSSIETIYISSLEHEKYSHHEKAKKHFAGKNVVLFDAGSVPWQPRARKKGS